MGIENVITGLRRRLEEEEEEEEDEEEKRDLDTDKMEVVGVHTRTGGGVEFDIASETNRMAMKPVTPALPLDDVLRYMMTGAPPKSR